MAWRYELSDEAWAVISGLFMETRSRGRRRLSDRLMLWRALGTLLGRWPARYAGALRPMVNGVSKISGLAKLGGIRSNAQTLAPAIE